jgi:long-chain fatty acid transport protein
VKKLITSFICCALFTGSIFAGGFQLNEHGARAMAMAGAFTGLANDPSAIYFNPAGITQLDGTNFSAGTTLILPISSFTLPKPSTAEYEMQPQVFDLINFYVTQKLSDKLSVGLGINNQFGLGTKWDPNWIGKYLAVETTLKSFFFTPVVAYKLLKNLSISAGPTIAVMSIKLSRGELYPTGTDFLLTLNSNNTTAVGFTAGILYKLNEKWQFGLSYRSQTKFNLTGTGSSDPASFIHPVYKIPIPGPNGDITAPLTTPMCTALGIAYTPDNMWTVTADVQYVGWSSYNDLSVTFNNYNSANPLAPGTTVLSTPRDYKDSYIARLGFEYKPVDYFAVRFGILFDHNPVQDQYVEPTLPDADRIGLTIGFGGKISNHLSLDVTYMFEQFLDRTVTNSVFYFDPAETIPANGTYSNQAHLFSLELNYNL